MPILKGKPYTPENMGSNFGHNEQVETGADGVTRPRWEAMWVDGLAEVDGRVQIATTAASQAGAAVVELQGVATSGAAALQAIADRVDGALADTVSTSEVGRALVNAATAADARAVLGVTPTVAASETAAGVLTRADVRRTALRHVFALS